MPSSGKIPKPALIRDLQEFAWIWNRNIQAQGYLKVVTGP